MADKAEDYEACFLAAPHPHPTDMLRLEDARHGHPQPVTARFEGNLPSWFFIHADTQPARAAGSGRPALFHYASGDHSLHACLHGKPKVDRTPAAIDRFRNDEVARCLPEGKDDPRVTPLRLLPAEGQVRPRDHGPTLFGSRFTGRPPEDHHEEVMF